MLLGQAFDKLKVENSYTFNLVGKLSSNEIFFLEWVIWREQEVASI